MATTILAYVIIGLFMAMERRARHGQAAQSLDKGAFDQGTTNVIGAAFLIAGLALFISPLLNHFKLGRLGLDAPVGWIGVAIALSRIALRLWANRVLGAFYTRTLRIADRQSIIQHAPYRFIRHPGYLGAIGMWVGAALATTNWAAVLVTVAVMIVAYAHRIQAEEAMLLAMNPRYGDYRARTWRLVPFIY